MSLRPSLLILTITTLGVLACGGALALQSVDNREHYPGYWFEPHPYDERPFLFHGRMHLSLELREDGTYTQTVQPARGAAIQVVTGEYALGNELTLTDSAGGVTTYTSDLRDGVLTLVGAEETLELQPSVRGLEEMWIERGVLDERDPVLISQISPQRLQAVLPAEPIEQLVARRDGMVEPLGAEGWGGFTKLDDTVTLQDGDVITYTGLTATRGDATLAAGYWTDDEQVGVWARNLTSPGPPLFHWDE